MNSIEAKNEFISFNKEMQKQLIIVMANNPVVDFNNAVSLAIQKLDNQFRLCEEGNLSDDELSNCIVYFHGDLSYKFPKTNEEKIDHNLNFIKFSGKFNELTGKECLVNQEISDNKKEVFLKDDKLWITDQLIDSGKAYYILKTYAEIVIENEKSLGINNLLFLLLNTFYRENIKIFDKNNKKFDVDINIPKIIYYSEDEVRYLLYNKAYNYFKLILNAFVNKFLSLNDLIDIMNNDTKNINLDNETLQKVINDINNDNIPDFPYYFL